MRFKILIPCCLLLVFSLQSLAQNFSNKGREFWVGYGHHQYMEPSCDGATAADNSMNMVLYLSAEEPAVVTVTIDSSGSTFVPAWKRTYIIPAYTVISTENLPKGSTNAAQSGSDPGYDARLFDYAPPIGSGGENLWRKKGIHIESSVPIVAYAHIYGGVSSGATMLMPTTTWGYSYTSVNSEQRDADRSYSWMYVIAKENNTLVQITPSAPSRRGKPANVPFTVLIQKGQIYQLVGQSDCATGNGPELTGTTVKSLLGPDGKCHPIAVFGGSSRTGGETLTCGTGSGRDNDMQQLFPEHAWGKRYATAPFSRSNGSTLQANSLQTSVYKVVVKDPTTIVKRNNVTLTGLINGKYYKFSSNTADYIVADKPIMVAQFMSGTSACNGGSGDPEMVIISPIEQAIKQTGFYRNTKEAIDANYLTLVVPTAGVASLRIDNSATFNYTYAHPNLPGYTVVVKGWASSQSQALVRCDSGFTAITYGLGGAESYGYNAGTYINNLSAIGAIHNTYDTTNTTNSFTCTKTPLEISVLMAYKPIQMEWLLSKLSAVLTPSANVLNVLPVCLDSPLVNGIKYYKYTLPGTYSFSDTGTFTVPIVVTSPTIDNCTQSDTVSYTITVKGKPVADFTYTHSGCATDTVYFTGNGSAGNYTINRWRWEFPTPITPPTDSTRYPKRVLPIGTHIIKLQVISQEGCIGDTTKPVTIGGAPATGFTITPGSICEPTSSYGFTSATAASAGTTFYWDFGNGNTSSGTTNTATNVYNTYGTFTVKHVASQTGQCPSDTARKTVVIFAKPRVKFGYPVGCLALDGTAQFSDSTINPDGQTLTYLWDFGDAVNSTTANPNTSTAQNPTHKYIAFGKYNIKLTVTTSNGCFSDTTIECTFAVRPVLAYSPIASVCESNPILSVANGSSINGVPGRGIYKGPGTDTLGNFNPAIAGNGIKTIWYIFTSTGGCMDSISQTIRVLPKPTAAFTVSDTSFCLNTSTTVTPTSTVSSGTIKNWKWAFGPVADTANYTNGNPFVHSYTTAGTYIIKLVNISDSSCVSDTVSKQVKINALPISSFNFTHTGCKLDTIFLTGASSTPNFTITKWKWNFSNGDTSILQNPNVVLPIGANTIKLTVYTAEGCSDTLTKPITVFAPPVAGLTGSPLSVCEPGTINFTDASTYGGTGAYIGSYWDFGNAQTVSNTNNNGVSGIYPTYGTYVVKHVVKVSDLCISDTATKTVQVFAKPRVNFTYPVGCLPVTNIAQFTNATVIPDGQAVTYKWYFGDPTSGPNDSSILQNPTHQYNNFGQYNIRLQVTSSNGCSKDTTIQCTFAVRPLLAYAPLTNVCESNPIISIAKGSSTNGVPGRGIYKGLGTDTLGNFNPAIAGPGIKTIWYIFTSTGGCTDSVSQTIKVLPKPTAAFTVSDTSFCLNKSTTLTPTSTVSNGTIKNWKWAFGPSADTANYTNGNPFVHSYTNPGTYTIRFFTLSDSSCSSDTISKVVKVNALPISSFTFTHTGCKLDTIFLTGAGSTPNFTITKWKWNFSNGDTSIVQNPNVLLPIGANTIKLTVATAEGCTDTLTKPITVFAPPVAGLTGSPLSICEPGTINFADASAYGGTGAYTSSYWDFGNMQTVTNTNNNGVSNLYPAYGTYSVKHVVKVSDLCISDTARQTVRVFAKPRVDFTYPIGCLPASNVAQFTNATVIPDGQTLTYSWNFGDPTSSSNTSSLQNPTHQYNNFGQFDIYLQVTTPNGCSKDTTIKVTFNIRPTLAFAPISSLCVNATATSIAKGSVTNGVPGTGVYRGPGTSAAGMFDPAVAGTGVKTIWYIFTSAAGCADSVSQTVRVNPKPTADFTLSSNSFCADATTVLTPQATISNGNIALYKWDFGDNTTANNLTNVAITKGYLTSGTYSVKFNAVSDSGCVSDIVTKSLTVNALPLVDFALPSSICMPAGRAEFSSLATVAGNSALTYTWNFGDLTPVSTQKDPVHIYSTKGAYQVNLEVTSAGGCKNDTTKTLSTFYDQPVASFDVTPQILCQGTPNVFTDLSTAAGSTISGWSWMFGDRTTSTASTPTKKYNFPGNFDIKLVVRSLQGCVSDTFTKNVKVYMQPVIDAGPSFVVSLGDLVTFKPTVNDSVSFSFAWTPSFALFNPNVLRPSITALTNETYYLTATGPGNCTATDSLKVSIMRPITIPNVFSPNGDGINDRWVITNLSDYPSANVKVFDRYGAQVFESTSYAKPWDGGFNSKPLPVGVYYYIIDLRNGFKAFTGSITILK